MLFCRKYYPFQFVLIFFMTLVLAVVPSRSSFAQGISDRPEGDLSRQSISESSPGFGLTSNRTTDASSQSISGLFFTIYGDPKESDFLPAITRHFIMDDNGNVTELEIPGGVLGPDIDLFQLNNTNVVVEGTKQQVTAQNSIPSLEVSKITPTINLTTQENTQGLTGTRPFISIMCKFKDIPDEPKTLSYFKGMYASTYPGLDHYWRELSYNNINILGSTAVGWFTLDHPKSYYVYDKNNDGNVELDFDRAAKDCTAKADPTVNFANYRNGGINLMFNSSLDCCAWGGGMVLTLDGINKVWPMTWEPVWGYSWITVIAHEMGHAFGLPHSSAHGGASGNVWDIMGDGYSNCDKSFDPIYGCIGQQTISFHKDLLGWIPSSQKFVLTPNNEAYVKLEQLEYPSSGNIKIIKIPINGSTTRFYTAELREEIGYDVKLPGSAVIIHKVDTQLGTPANVVDPGDNTDTSDDGAQWIAGEIFRKNADHAVIAILSEDATGTWVYICSGIVPIPGAPLLKAPANAATIKDNTPTLSWEPVPYGFKSQIQLSTSSTFETIDYNVLFDPRTLKWTAPLLEDGKYYWRVQNINVNNGEGPWSEVRRFKVDTVPPAAPILIKPLDGISVIGTPKYKWEAVLTAQYYQFAYAISSDFSDVVYTSPKISTVYFVPPTQKPGEYYWHVRAKDAAGNWGEWSAAWKIIIN